MEAISSRWNAWLMRGTIEKGVPNASAVPDNIAGHFVEKTGDVDRALAKAELVLKEEFYIQRHSGVPLETRGLVAEYDSGQRLLTIWGATKVVHFNHAVLAGLLDMPPSCIRMIELENGGGYGIRGEFYPEDFLIPFIAMRLGRPIAWVEDRNEHLKSANHSREQWHRSASAPTRKAALSPSTTSCSTSWADISRARCNCADHDGGVPSRALQVG
jgi:CO/xanthine dehydrogenase Mo-binding subunit